MSLVERLRILADPKSQDQWEPLYDELDKLPSINESDIALLVETLRIKPDCDYALVRLFCLDLLAVNSISQSLFMDELRLVIQYGNDAERSTAFQLLREDEENVSDTIRMLESVDMRELPFFARWELRKLIKMKLRKKEKPEGVIP